LPVAESAGATQAECELIPKRPSSLRIATLALSVVGITCGCGSGATDSPNATQVVARINGHELTISQLNQALVAMHASDSGPAAQQQALKGLIDEELVVQAAQKATLDRDRDVMISMDAESREILVRAYAEQHIYPSGSIEDSELHNFYDANPALFSARNIYHAAVFNIEQGPLAAELQTELDQARSADAVRGILSRKNIGFQTEEITRAAEAIPLSLLPKLTAAGTGSSVIAKSEGGRTQLFVLTGLESSPLSFDQVSSEIGQFLTTQRNTAALKTYLQQLRAASKIEYANVNVPRPPALNQ
jgi:EpsD family peptidyl-prolyl cis-trans isomerase